ncbi:MAG: 2Fe-2S iron-sulfur cluster-binding protein [bacterium]
MEIGFTLNGDKVAVDALPMARLLDVLREDLRVTGTRRAAGRGVRGLHGPDRRPRRQRVPRPGGPGAGAAVTTVEGLAEPGGPLHPVQAAFLQHGGAQCGICTPGFLVAAAELLARTPRPTRPQVREALAGNLCRCTGYQKIVDAVAEALAGEAGHDHEPRSRLQPRHAGRGPRAARRPSRGDAPGGGHRRDGLHRVGGRLAGCLPQPLGRRRPAGHRGGWGRVRIGALCTYTELEADAGVQAHAPALVEAARTVGAKQIQNRGTLAGNVANASPAGDTLPVLLALDAEVEVASVRGCGASPWTRSTWATASWRWPRRADHGDLPARPAPGGRAVLPQGGDAPGPGHQQGDAGRAAAHRGRRRHRGPGGLRERRRDARRARTVEAALIGRPVDAAAADQISADIRPIDDIRSTAAYRLEVARRILQGWLLAVARGDVSASG